MARIFRASADACTHFVSAAWARLRSRWDRSRRVERNLDALLDLTRRMEIIMADNQSELLAKLDALKAEVDAYTTDRGKQIADAVAAAKTAWASESKAEHDAALAKLDEISKALVQFTPSGN